MPHSSLTVPQPYDWDCVSVYIQEKIGGRVSYLTDTPTTIWLSLGISLYTGENWWPCLIPHWQSHSHQAWAAIYIEEEFTLLWFMFSTIFHQSFFNQSRHLSPSSWDGTTQIDIINITSCFIITLYVWMFSNSLYSWTFGRIYIYVELLQVLEGAYKVICTYMFHWWCPIFRWVVEIW